MTAANTASDTAASASPDCRAQRADARRNYDRLLVAAEAAFAEEGAEASLDGIARRAGVGIGTLYRHFPTRQHLLEAVFLSRVEDLRVEAECLLDAPSSLAGLEQWLRSHIAVGRNGRSLGASVMAAKLEEGSEVNTACARMAASGEALLARAQAEGAVGADIQLGDVLHLLHAMVVVNEGKPDCDERTERMLDLVLAGLRPVPGVDT